LGSTVGEGEAADEDGEERFATTQQHCNLSSLVRITFKGTANNDKNADASS